MDYIAIKVVLVSFSLWLSCIQAIQNGGFPTLLAFGDSVLDTGNNNRLITVIRSDFKPYGRDFPTHKPTGRFGNGKVLSDFLAASLGIKALLPAFRSTSLNTSELSTGVSFASGGSGVDELTAKMLRVIGLEGQVKDFQRYMEKLKEEVGDAAKVQEIIANALILISAGNNDIGITYFASRARKLSNNIQTYTDMLIGWKTTFIKNLYDLGVRKFAVIGTMPLGCLPGAREQKFGDYLCNLEVNHAARVFNQKVLNLVDKFGQNFPDAKFVYIDLYKPLNDISSNPSQYGFTTAKPCCCSVLAPLPCSNSSNHVFWDFAHPAEKAYNIILPGVVNTIHNKFA